jgi:hypothetical protein
MGQWYYGYESNGITFNKKQAVWHLPEEVLESAQESGAKLEIVFTSDISSLTVGEATDHYAMFALVWQGIDTERWWPSELEAGDDNENLIIFGWDVAANEALDVTGVSYDSTSKKLTIVMEDALETYSGFSDATDVNILLNCWYGTDDINTLGIVSANIVE